MVSMKTKPLVLIVDDSVDNLRVLTGMLKNDYRIQVAQDGTKALHLANKKPQPDIVLLDVMMPGMDGYEVCARLKSDPKSWSIPVMFITALTRYKDEHRGLTLGAVDFISKPINFELLKARIRSQIDLKKHKDHVDELVKKRTHELSVTQDVTIMTLAALAESRDPETGGHITRTQNYMHALAMALRNHKHFSEELTEPNIALLHKSAPLHDVGKVGVPDDILLKPGKLTPEEFVKMKKHALYGYNALSRALNHLGDNSFLRYAAEIAYTHHERWDGAGYPQGLKGHNIPISGRLMAVADVYDALISKRVYKPPMPHTKAAAIIQKERGHHFDSDVVDAFFSIEDEIRQIAMKSADFPEEYEAVKN